MIYYHLALRYTRIFPEIFEIVDIDDVEGNAISQGHPTTRYHIGCVGDGGDFGTAFVDFMQSSPAQQLYAEHGLAPLH